MKRIIEKMVPIDDPMAKIQSPTDMGVNMSKQGIIKDRAGRKASKQEIIRRYYQYKRGVIEGNTTYDTLERMDNIMKRVEVKPTDRAVAVAANNALIYSTMDPNKGNNGYYAGAAIEIWDKDDTIMITGKLSPTLHSESAALLNAVKTIAGIPDEIDILSPIIIDSIMKLKKQMNMPDLTLDVREVLDALAVSAVFNPNAAECIKALPMLKNCEMHSTHLMESGCEKPLKELHLNITTDAKIPKINSI
jgi:uncharacterized protein (UPF0371 family)